MNVRRRAAVLAAAVVVSLSGVGVGPALADPAPAGPTVHPTPPPVTPVTPVHPVTPSGGSGTHHPSHATSSTTTSGSDSGSVLPLLLGGLGIAVVAGGGAYALTRGGAADRERERRADVRIVTVPPPVAYGYDQPPYVQPPYAQAGYAPAGARPYAVPRHR